jgi:leucyl-tRNA synthetase
VKFLSRALRISHDVTSKVGADIATGHLPLRKVTHKALADIAFAVESFRFNVAVARIMELVNATRKAIDSGPGGADPAVREAAEAIAISLSLIAPFTAEEMWEKLGHKPSVARAGWPKIDESLLVAEKVIALLQVNGKIKDRIEVAPGIDEVALREIALANPAMIEAIGQMTVKNVIVRAPKLVNVVV